ncbi:MAG: A/G-specific adenine glycosylase [Clostridia bacterium]|nr:A/G-specific adenine glycosylase [Clostridia bacterium]
MKKALKNCLTPDSVAGLLAWYRASCRDLPWRRTRDPYHIWLSEIMLQQTRVEAVKPYYARFLEAAPTVASLAALPEDQLMKLWEGLGYYSRARNLQRAARRVVEQYGGALPATYEELLTLPGVGEYTAGAVASIAFGERVPAIDGNVLRVLSRVSGSDADIADPSVKKAFREELSELIPPDAGDFTQAMIELGATLCGPNTAPVCDACPLRDVCEARRLGLTDSIPVKRAKKARRVEKKTVLLIRDGDRTALHKRPDTGLLSGLYELPNVEGHLDERALLDYIRSIGFEPLRVERIEDAKHIFTHIEWHMIAYDVRITPEFDGYHGQSGMLLVPNGELHERYAVPSAFSAYTRYL